MGVGDQRPPVTVEVARHVLAHFGDTNLGIEGGAFVVRLLHLAAACDQENRNKLGAEWPEYMVAFDAAAFRPWGIEWLRSIVAADLTHREQGLDFSEVRA